MDPSYYPKSASSPPKPCQNRAKSLVKLPSLSRAGRPRSWNPYRLSVLDDEILDLISAGFLRSTCRSSLRGFWRSMIYRVVGKPP